MIKFSLLISLSISLESSIWIIEHSKVSELFSNFCCFCWTLSKQSWIWILLTFCSCSSIISSHWSKVKPNNHSLKSEYSDFKEWLFGLTFDQWEEIIDEQEQKVNSIHIQDCFDNVQQKQQKLEKSSLTFECSIIQIDDSKEIDKLINKENLIIVSFDGYLWLTTYDYQFFGRLAGENIDKLNQFDRQTHDLIINSVDMERRVVSISVYWI